MSKKGVKISEDPPAVKEIAHRSEVLEIVPVIDPMTGELVHHPLTEGERRQYDTATRDEQMLAAIQARSERQLPWWQRGYKNEKDARQRDKPKQYNPKTGKWEGGKKKRITRKRRSKKKWTSSATRKRN